MDTGKEYRRWITSRQWAQLRRQVLTRRPLCQRCEEHGRIASAEEVHHIRPVESAVGIATQRALMFNPGNLMALCHNCHVEVHTELGRSGKDANRKRNAQHSAEVIARFFGSSNAGGEG